MRSRGKHVDAELLYQEVPSGSLQLSHRYVGARVLQALTGRKKLLGNTHVDTLMTANNYGSVAKILDVISCFMCQSCGMKLHCAQLSTPIQETTVGRHQYTEESCTLVLVRSLPSEQRPLCYWADHAVLPSSKVQLGCTSVASTPGLLKEAEAIFLEVLKNCRKTLGARALAPQSFCFSNLELPTEVKHSYTLTCANSLGGLLHEVVSFVVRLCALFWN